MFSIFLSSELMLVLFIGQLEVLAEGHELMEVHTFGFIADIIEVLMFDFVMVEFAIEIKQHLQVILFV